MLRTVESMLGYTILATDGNIGSVYDFYFDDEDWTVRYLVVDTGNWLPGRRVLIYTGALGQPDWRTRQFPVSLNKEQVAESPDIDTTKPISRRHERELHNHFGWASYWSSGGVVTPEHPHTGSGREEMPPKLKEELKTLDPQPYDAGLRSSREVTGYRIQATDGEIGHVEDFMVDDSSWSIRYAIIDTRNWLPGGKKVLISPDWLAGIDWADSKVSVRMSKEAIKDSPEYDPSEAINREYEVSLYDYYGWPYYWS